MRLPLLPLVAVLLLARSASAGPALDAAVAAEAAERDRLEDEKRRRQTEAAALARLAAETPTRRREFDRLVERLDRLDRDLAGQDRRLSRAVAAFTEAAEREERRLEEAARRQGAGAVAADHEALEAARRRVAALRVASGFRPPLDVAIDPLDGAAELETKLVLLHGEEARVAERLAELRAEDVLLGARLAAKREWARQLGSARRDAAGRIELLDRGYEEARAAIRRLSERQLALPKEQEALQGASRQLAVRRAEVERRLEELRTVR
jgi:hypothetical protein